MTERAYAEKYGAEFPDKEEGGVCPTCGEQLQGDVGEFEPCLNRCPSCQKHMDLVSRRYDIWDCKKCEKTFIWDKDKEEFTRIPFKRAESLIEDKEEK